MINKTKEYNNYSNILYKRGENMLFLFIFLIIFILSFIYCACILSGRCTREEERIHNSINESSKMLK